MYSKGTLYCGRKINHDSDKTSFYQIMFQKSSPDDRVIINNFSTGNSHILALDSEKKIWGWGLNKNGKIDPTVETLKIDLPREINQLVCNF